MYSQIFIGTAAVLGGLGWAVWLGYAGSEQPLVSQDGTTPDRLMPSSASASPSLPSPRLMPTSVPVQGAAGTASQAAAAGVQPASGARVMSGEAGTAGAPDSHITALGLTHELTGEHTIAYQGQTHSILGTRQTAGASGTQTVLVLRDDSSGQIIYRQSALQIVLKPGQDPEAFVQQNAWLERRFVNPEQVQVNVDAAHMARAYSAIANDPRVVSVSFMPVTAARKIK